MCSRSNHGCVNDSVDSDTEPMFNSCCEGHLEKLRQCYSRQFHFHTGLSKASDRDDGIISDEKIQTAYLKTRVASIFFLTEPN